MKITVWECDRCLTRVEQGATPKSWVQVSLQGVDQTVKSPSHTLMLCITCATEVKSHLMKRNTVVARRIKASMEEDLIHDPLAEDDDEEEDHESET